MNIEIKHYSEQILAETPTIPAIMTEEIFFDCISQISGENITHFDDIYEKNLKNIFLYGIEEDKKQISIKTIQKIIENISLRPYEGKHIFVIRDFDTAGIPAQNSALKLIEECPPYAVIIMLVTDHKSLLETILSRAILLIGKHHNTEITDEVKIFLKNFLAGKKSDFISYIYNHSPDRNESIAILIWVFGELESRNQGACKDALNHLHTSKENPRNILESFFLGTLA